MLIFDYKLYENIINKIAQEFYKRHRQKKFKRVKL